VVQVQIQQLVHHVSANSDHLRAGTQICTSVGEYLQTAARSNHTAREKLSLSLLHIKDIQEVEASMLVAALYQRSRMLRRMVDTCTDALYSILNHADHAPTSTSTPLDRYQFVPTLILCDVYSITSI
jgi:hypothetical protein